MESRLVRNLYYREVAPGTMGVYNPIGDHNFAFIPKSLFESLRDGNPVEDHKEDLQKLTEKKFLVPVDFSEKSYFDKLREKLKTDIHLMYLLVSQDCNLNCSYCFEELPIREKRLMSVDVAEKAIDFFLKTATPKRKIIFYGGEPLLNKKIVKAAVNRVRAYETEKEPTELVVITNGTLVDKNIANLFSEKKVQVSVSIDGPQEFHDIARRDKAGRGSYSRAIRGYNLLKDAGVNPSISCTIGEHNLEHLLSVGEFFADELKPSTVGFNLLIKSGGNGKPSEEYSQQATKKLIETFELLRDHGIYEDRIMRRLEKICNKECYLKECAAYGNQIVVRYDGKVGPCHAFAPTGQFFAGDIRSEDFSLNQEIFGMWAKRNQLNNKFCEECPAITLCGGGCAYNANTENGDIDSVDNAICAHTKGLIRLGPTKDLGKDKWE